MKAGVVQLLFALAALDSTDGVAVLLTTDEETGSPTARPLIEETAAGIEAALVLEPSADGALKTERKGVSLYRINVQRPRSPRRPRSREGCECRRRARSPVARGRGARAARARDDGDADARRRGNGGQHGSGGGVRAGGRARPNGAGGERIAAAFAALEPVDPATSLDVEAKRLDPAARARRLGGALRARAGARRWARPGAARGSRCRRGLRRQRARRRSACRCSTASAPSATTRTPKASTSRSMSLPTARRWWPRSCRIYSDEHRAGRRTR